MNNNNPYLTGSGFCIGVGASIIPFLLSLFNKTKIEADRQALIRIENYLR